MVFQTIEIPLLPVDMVIDVPVEVVIISFMVQRPFPVVQTVQRIMETLQLPFDTVVVVLLLGVQDIPIVTQRQIPMVWVTLEIPQLLFDKVVHVPVVQVEPVPHMPAWRRQSCSGVSTASCGMKLVQGGHGAVVGSGS